MTPHTWALGALAAGLLLCPMATARADRVRFHYPVTAVCVNPALVPGAASAVTGERVSYFGARSACPCPLRPTCMVTFCHRYSGANVIVPLRLPEDTPLIQHRGDTTLYNYGSYAVEVTFLSDGSVDVVYNSGFGRPISWCLQP